MSSMNTSLQCDSHIASSFFAVPIIMQRRIGQDLSIPAIVRTFLEPSLLMRDVVDIERFRDVH